MTQAEVTLREKGIPPTHPAMADFLAGEKSFHLAVDDHARRNHLSSEAALIDLQGQREPRVPAAELTPAERKKLDEADAIRAKAESAEAERQRITAEWNRRTLAIEALQGEEANLVREQARVKTGREAHLAAACGRSGAVNGLTPLASCYEAAGCNALLPVFQSVIDERRVEIAAAIAETRAFGKAHNVPANLWPAEPTTTTTAV